MARKRLDEWLGKNVGLVAVKADGTIHVDNLPKATNTLEPLRGLPIGSIHLGVTAVRSLEPLRHHLSLQYIAIGSGGPYRPAAEFWADYDAQQAADKK